MRTLEVLLRWYWVLEGIYTMANMILYTPDELVYSDGKKGKVAPMLN
jgi:hypothetical protein